MKKSEEGQLLLNIYKNEKKLNNDLRNKLAKIIVSNELSPNITNTIKSERASFLSDSVIKLFPTEDKVRLHFFIFSFYQKSLSNNICVCY